MDASNEIISQEINCLIDQLNNQQQINSNNKNCLNSEVNRDLIECFCNKVCSHLLNYIQQYNDKCQSDVKTEKADSCSSNQDTIDTESCKTMFTFNQQHQEEIENFIQNNIKNQLQKRKQSDKIKLLMKINDQNQIINYLRKAKVKKEKQFDFHLIQDQQIPFTSKRILTTEGQDYDFNQSENYIQYFSKNDDNISQTIINSQNDQSIVNFQSVPIQCERTKKQELMNTKNKIERMLTSIDHAWSHNDNKKQLFQRKNQKSSTKDEKILQPENLQNVYNKSNIGRKTLPKGQQINLLFTNQEIESLKKNQTIYNKIQDLFINLNNNLSEQQKLKQQLKFEKQTQFNLQIKLDSQQLEFEQKSNQLEKAKFEYDEYIIEMRKEKMHQDQLQQQLMQREQNLIRKEIEITQKQLDMSFQMKNLQHRLDDLTNQTQLIEDRKQLICKNEQQINQQWKEIINQKKEIELHKNCIGQPKDQEDSKQILNKMNKLSDIVDRFIEKQADEKKIIEKEKDYLIKIREEIDQERKKLLLEQKEFEIKKKNYDEITNQTQ